MIPKPHRASIVFYVADIARTEAFYNDADRIGDGHVRTPVIDIRSYDKRFRLDSGTATPPDAVRLGHAGASHGQCLAGGGAARPR